LLTQKSAFWILEIIAENHVSSPVFCKVKPCALVDRGGLSWRWRHQTHAKLQSYSRSL